VESQENMSIFDRFKKKKTITKQDVKDRPSKKSAKEIANAAGEPYINVLGLEVDPENLHAGAFELDWNDKFVSNLIRAGYRGKTDADIVDQWFQTVCRNVVLETYEQEQAINPDRYIKSRDIGNGRREVS